MIPYGKHNINKSDILSVTQILKNKFITQGKAVDKFENAIKKHWFGWTNKKKLYQKINFKFI